MVKSMLFLFPIAKRLKLFGSTATGQQPQTGRSGVLCLPRLSCNFGFFKLAFGLVLSRLFRPLTTSVSCTTSLNATFVGLLVWLTQELPFLTCLLYCCSFSTNTTKLVNPYASAAQQGNEKPRKITSINSLSQDVLSLVFGFLVGAKLEDVAPLAEVGRAFNIVARRLIVIRRIQIRAHARFGRNPGSALGNLVGFFHIVASAFHLTLMLPKCREWAIPVCSQLYRFFFVFKYSCCACVYCSKRLLLRLLGRA